MATLIRDALEEVLVAGVKAWKLDASAAEVRDGVRCFQDDGELLAAAKTLDVPEDALIILPSLLKQHPNVLDGEQARQAFNKAYQGRLVTVIKKISQALGILEPLLQDEVDPDYLGSVLGALTFLAMERCCPEVRKVSQALGLAESKASGLPVQYASAVVKGGRQVTTRAHAQIMATELGRLINWVLRRQSRRTFTLLAVGDRPALAMVLAQIIEEVNYANNRTDSSRHEVHEEEAR